MGPERVVVPAPTIGQDLCLWGCGEQLSVEKLIPEPATVTARKDDAPAAGQAAINNVAAVTPFSCSGGLIQTTSG